MADQKLRVILEANSDKLIKGLNKSSNKLQQFGKEATRIGKNLTVGLSTPIALAGVKALSSAAKFEKLQTQLNVLTGSAKKGTEAFKQLVEFSAGTPFQLDELVQANNTLMGFGVSAEDAFKHLQSIGDIAAVSGGDLQGISVAFGQVAAAGRLMGQDLLQLINNGVPIIDMLSDSMGVAKSEIKDMVSEGKVTFPVLIKAFQDATGEGGKFSGGMQQLSGTLGGVFSTLKDNINIAFAEIGKSIVESTDLVEVSKKVISKIQELTQKFKDLSPEAKKFALIVAGVAAAIGPILIVVGQMSIGFGALIKALPLVVGGFRLLTAAMIANPILAVATAIAAVTAAIISYKKSQKEANKVALEQMNAAQLGEKIEALEKRKQALYKRGYKDGQHRVQIVQDEIDVYKKQLVVVNEAIKANEDLEKQKNKTAAAPIQPAAGPVRQQATGVSALGATAGTAMGTTQQLNLDAGSSLLGEMQTVNTDPVAMLAASVAGSTEELKSKLSAANEVVRAKGIEQQLIAQEITAGMNAVINNGVQGIVSGLAEAVAAGGNVAGAMGKVLLEGIGNMAIQLGQLALSSGLAIEAIKAALKSLAGPVAIAAGIALIALGSFVKGRAAAIGNSKGDTSTVSGPRSGAVAAFANGGIVSGPTLGLMGEYAGARSNPEVIAPLDKLKNMIGDRQAQQVNVGGEFRLNGQDLVVALQRAEKQRGRIK
jgi:tape measure domain-containing protein